MRVAHTEEVRSPRRRIVATTQSLPAHFGFEERYAWGSSTISTERIRFVLTTDAYGPWWRRNRRPRRRERLAMLRRQGKIPKSV